MMIHRLQDSLSMLVDCFLFCFFFGFNYVFVALSFKGNHSKFKKISSAINIHQLLVLFMTLTQKKINSHSENIRNIDKLCLFLTIPIMIEHEIVTVSSIKLSQAHPQS